MKEYGYWVMGDDGKQVWVGYQDYWIAAIGWLICKISGYNVSRISDK